jgi:hypothetical protein
MTQSARVQPPLKAYWQPGCTSCLRMKEFLQKHQVPFVSVNVLADKSGFAELAELGIRSVPIVRRGSDWANGQVLEDVARVAGIPWGGAQKLPPAMLFAKLTAIQDAAQGLFAQLPEDKMAQMLPNRPRSYAQLVYHIFNIADAFLEHEIQGLPLEEGAYNRVPPPGMNSQALIAAYGRGIRKGLDNWWRERGQTADFARKARVYYGDVSLHDFLERTAWHSGQHVRQLVMVLGMLGIAPKDPPGADVFAGLPMPEKVWDDEPMPA